MNTEKKENNKKPKIYKFDEKYSDLLVFDDQPKRQLKSLEIHESDT